MGDPPRVASDARFLQVQDLTLTFGGLRVLDRVAMTVDRGTVCGLVGPNGAGKTSLFNCVSGHYRPDGGSG
jgi:branched-chain amino acid transport system ATP-binding protein